ncbi:MAG TPA: hypothetical protein V6C95_18255, partial [Coleofasciculaceae cyanobacterium]
LSVEGTAALQAYTDGQGNAGNIIVQVDDSVSLIDGGIIDSSVKSRGQGIAGTIQIIAPNSVNISGLNPSILQASGLYTNAFIGSTGNSGNVSIRTGQLDVIDGGQVLTTSLGTGNAGDLSIIATDFVNVVNPNSRLNTSAVGTTGNSGSLSINTGKLNISDLGEVATSSLGVGNAGELAITATESVNVSDRSIISTSSQGAGNSGKLSISTRQLDVNAAGIIATTSLGTGDAGELAIAATDSVNVSDRSIISTNSQGSGNGDKLSISTRQLDVNAAGIIATTSLGTGNAGELAIAATDSVNVRDRGIISTGSSGVGNSSNLSIRTRQLDVINSGIDGGISTAALGSGNSGNLSIIATDSINVVGTSNVTTLATQGVAGSLYLETGKLSIRDNSLVVTSTLGAGDAGELAVQAEDLVEVTNGSKLSANTFGEGNGGDLTIDTDKLSVRDRGEISTVVTTNSSGNAGTLTVRANELIEVLDSSKIATETYGSGDGGDLNIETQILSVQNRGEVSTGVFPESSGRGGNLSVTASDSVELMSSGLVTATLGAGRAGDLSVATRRLIAQDGGRIEAGTAGFAPGGTVNVNASESIELNGKSPSGITPSGISAFSSGSGNAPSGNVNLITGELIIQDSAEVTTATLGSGKGGDIQVQADSISLSDRARILSRSEGQGLAGNISLNLQDTLQTNGGEISASSDQSGGGDINITADKIILRNGSLISSSVFDSTGGGGNIAINSEIFLALEDSDILANAQAGSGGNITINSEAFLAELFSSSQATPVGRNPGSFAQFRGNGRVDISADSQAGTSGNVSFPTIDPTLGFAPLPSDFVDPADLIDRRCTPEGTAQNSSFVVTGRGGLPPNPSEPLNPDAVSSNWVTLDSEEDNSNHVSINTNSTPSSPKQIVEAQGWVIGLDGQVILTAQAPIATPYHSLQTASYCHQ